MYTPETTRHTPKARGILLALFVIMSGLISMTATAQDEDESLATYEFPDSGTSISYPDSWKVTEEDDGSLTLNGNTLVMYVFDPATLVDSYDIDPESTPYQVMLSLTDILDSSEIDFDKDEVEETESEGREIASYVFTNRINDERSGWVAIALADEQIGLVGYTSTIDAFDEAEDAAMAVIATFGTGSGGGFSIDFDEVNFEPTCFVSTETERTVRVHVGPGLNRTPFAFLPSKVDFAVLGEAEANDGSLWFKLDKEEVAPEKSANEAWVNQEEVDTSGDCDAVPDAEAPPIIPIVVAPAEGEEGVTVLPNNGVWSARSSTMTYTCPDGRTGTIEPEGSSFRTSLRVADDGATLTVANIMMNRVQPGFYTGQYDLVIEGEIVIAYVNLQVISETEIQWTESATIQGCNLTLPVSARQG